MCLLFLFVCFEVPFEEVEFDSEILPKCSRLQDALDLGSVNSARHFSLFLRCLVLFGRGLLLVLPFVFCGGGNS